MSPRNALLSSVLQALKEKTLALLIIAVLVAAPLYLFMGLALPGVVLATIAIVWLWRGLRKLIAHAATRAFQAGDIPRAKRLYWLLLFAGTGTRGRLSCRLSLAACAATEEKYGLAQRRLQLIRGATEGAFYAVHLNLQAYCLARQKQRLEDALEMSKEAVALRNHVLGFRHTRGIVYMELGQLDLAIREFEATWKDGSGVFESERCFDLGRLWQKRGHDEYADDYFQRAVRACPNSNWAKRAEAEVSEATRLDGHLQSVVGY